MMVFVERVKGKAFENKKGDSRLEEKTTKRETKKRGGSFLKQKQDKTLH